MSGSTPKRTPAQKIFRYVLGTVMVAAIIYALSLIPYEILREERFRLFGEASIVGVVIAIDDHGMNAGDNRFTVQYTYVDQDGVPRRATAPLPENIWKKYHIGSRVRVIYALSHPKLSRIKDEIEPGFQLWLRSMLQ